MMEVSNTHNITQQYSCNHIRTRTELQLMIMLVLLLLSVRLISSVSSPDRSSLITALKRDIYPSRQSERDLESWIAEHHVLT